MRKHLLILSLVGVATTGFADDRRYPQFTFDTTIFYNVKSPRDAHSGQASGKRTHKPLRMRCSPEESSGLLATFTDPRFAPGSPPRPVSVILWGQDQRVHTQVDMMSSGPLELTLPACSVDMSEGADCDMAWDVQARKYPDFPKEDKGGPPRGKQKAWLPANFRLKIDGLEDACARVNKIDSFTIKQSTADDDGDGAPDTEFSEFSFTCPVEAAPPFMAWSREAGSGLATGRRMHMVWPFNDGTPFCTLAMDVIPVSVDWADVFESPFAFPGREVKVTVKKDPRIGGGWDLAVNKKV